MNAVDVIIGAVACLTVTAFLSLIFSFYKPLSGWIAGLMAQWAA